MARRIAALLAATACLIPAVSAAGPCEDLAGLALKTGGKWQAVKELPARSVAQDGPWYAGEALYEEDNSHRPSGFTPQAHPADRQRILNEVGQIDPAGRALASAYLSPSAKAFEAAMKPVAENTDSGDIAVRIHRWPKTSVFAVSAHDNAWYQCQREVVLFYTGADGKLHYASSNGMDDCVARGDALDRAQPVLIDGRFAFMDEEPDQSSVTGEVGLWQVISLWQGDRLAAGCPLAYTYEIGYILSDQSRPENETGRTRELNVFDDFLTQSFQQWMPGYAAAVRSGNARPGISYEQDKQRARENDIATLRAFSGNDATVFANLKVTYNALFDSHRSGIVRPVRRGNGVYLVVFRQQMRGSALYPYIDVVIYSADGQPPMRLANIVIERVPQKVLSVKVAAKPN